jgi:DNA polymerase III delta prime subunit
MTIIKAGVTRQLKILLAGEEGSGKTTTALEIAKALGKRKICVIDTENCSSGFYKNIVEFDMLGLKQPRSADLIEAVDLLEKEGYDCIIVDSLTHWWLTIFNNVRIETGKKDALGKQIVNGMAVWGNQKAEQGQAMNRLLFSPALVIATVRCKDDLNAFGNPVFKLEQDKRIGFDFDVIGLLDKKSHSISPMKSRLSASGLKQDPDSFLPLGDFIEGLKQNDRS